MTHGNLEALAGEMLAVYGVVAQIDKGLRAIEAPAVVIQGDQDRARQADLRTAPRRRAARRPPGDGQRRPHGALHHPAAIAAASDSSERPQLDGWLRNDRRLTPRPRAATGGS